MDAEKRAAVEPMRCTGLKDRPPRRRLSAHTFRRFGKQARRGKIFFHTRNYPAETGRVILWAVYFSGQVRCCESAPHPLLQDQAEGDIEGRRARRSHQRIGELRFYVRIQIGAYGHGGQDRGIGKGRAVVAENAAGHHRADGQQDVCLLYTSDAADEL